MEPAQPVHIIGVACGAGAPDPGCAEGPRALREGGLVSRLRRAGLDAVWNATIEAPAERDPFRAVALVTTALARRARDLAAHKRLPVVLGGDHSCAIGTWRGIAAGLASRGPLGLIWIDAHMDAHTPQTTRSGMLHGMPLACLLGYGDPRLTAIAGGARLYPGLVCLIGVRSFEIGEAALLQRLGVRVFFMHEVARRGLPAVLAEAIGTLRDRSAALGVSLDLDALDPRAAPGVGSPVPRGIRPDQLLAALAAAAPVAPLAGIEVVEYNPYRDTRGATARIAAAFLEALLARTPAQRVPANGPSGNDEEDAAERTRRRAA